MTLLIRQTTAGWYGYCRKVTILPMGKNAELLLHLQLSESHWVLLKYYLRAWGHPFNQEPLLTVEYPSTYVEHMFRSLSKAELNWIKIDDGRISPPPCHTALHYTQKSDHAKLHNFYVLAVSWDDTAQCTVNGIPECIQQCILGWSHTSGLKSLNMLKKFNTNTNFANCNTYWLYSICPNCFLIYSCCVNSITGIILFLRTVWLFIWNMSRRIAVWS